MNKKITKVVTLLIIVLASSIVMTSFSKSPSTVKGYIQSYGNVPFTYPVITTKKGKTYYIIASDATKKDLLDRQGREIKVTGYTVKDKEQLPPFCTTDEAIKVEYWEVIEKKDK